MKRLVVNAFCPGEHKVVSSHGTKTDLPPPGSPCYLMQNARSKDRVCGTNSVKRAVAQLGRAPGSGPGGRGFKSHQPDSKRTTVSRSSLSVPLIVTPTHAKPSL